MPKVISIARESWSGQWMNRQHLAWALQKKQDVLYVQEPQSFGKRLRSRGEGYFHPTVESPTPSLQVLRLPKCLARRSKWGKWNATTFELKSRLIQRYARLDSLPILIVWHPHLVHYFRTIPAAVKVYYMYDVPYAWQNNPNFSRDFEAITTLADICIGVTPEQTDLLPREKARLIRNAAPLDWYQGPASLPEEIARIPHPRVGYVGRISHKVDLSWLEALADCRKLNLVLVGPLFLEDESSHRFQRLVERPNVYYLGAQPAQRVPDYIRALDVGLMCYTRGLWCESGSPIKLYEYCAAGVPIVASRIRSLTSDAEASALISFADTPNEAVAEVLDILGGAEQPSAVAFALKNSWDARADELMRLSEDEHRGFALR